MSSLGETKENDPLDFEEALRVIQIDEETYVGAHPLRLPLAGARGVYGGHTCAQTLLVAIESTPGFIPHSYHSYFIKAGSPSIPFTFKVTKLHDGRTFCMRQIRVIQKDKVIYTAMCSLVKKGVKATSELNIMHQPPPLHKKYPDPSKLHNVKHTDFIRNAYSDEFSKFALCPEEDRLRPSERWITVWSGLDQPHKTSVTDPKYNYVGLADLSDSALLTTLARVLHLDWNPTVDNPFESFDETKDARNIMSFTLNALHIFHYNAMSLDHHLYFHCDDFETGFDVVKDWLTLTYQFKILKNNRALVRGFFYNKEGNCVATVIQEGLTYMKPGVPNNPKM